MISEENLNKIYDSIIEKNTLTTKELNEYGFNSKDINDLIQRGLIERIKRGYYSMKSANELYQYGKKLIFQNENKKADLCFEKCFELDPNHLGVCFQLFLKSIQTKNYERAFELYELLVQTENVFYNRDLNFYLYLLSMVTDVPEKYREYVKFLKLKDIMIKEYDKRYKDIRLQNNLRLSALNKKFAFALKQLDNLMKKHGKPNAQDIITRSLLNQILVLEALKRNKINDLIKEKRYKELREYLLKKQEKNGLSKSEECMLVLSESIIEIIDTNRIPVINTTETDDIFLAINEHNYPLALQLSSQYNEKNNIANETNAINLLLVDICNYIKKLPNKNKTQKETQKDTEDKENTITNPTPNVIKPKTEYNFSTIISYLTQNDLTNAFIALKGYLESVNKLQYSFLIVNLIKISVLEKDSAFTKPMLALSLITRDNYVFDISTYIQEFYISLSHNKFEEARIYLSIISNANNLGQECIITDGLAQVLENMEKAVNYKYNDSLLNVAEKALEQSESSHDVVQEEHSTNTNNNLVNSKPNDEIISKDSSLDEYIEEDSDSAYVESLYQELLDKKGIIVLKPMNQTREKIINDLLEYYPDIETFIMESNSKCQIVIRYKNINKGYVDFKNLIRLGHQAYKDGNYDECIENFLMLLQCLKEPKAFVYSQLGLAYLKKQNIPKAIDYLSVATYISRQDGSTFDFEDLIAKLKGEKLDKDKKPNVRMTLDDFNYDDVDDNYGIDNFKEINEYIIISGLDVESACEELGLNSEQINIIRLIYAKQFYSQGEFEKGDSFILTVEKDKNKTPNVTRLMNSIRNKRKFYQNRRTKEKDIAILTIMPRKK